MVDISQFNTKLKAAWEAEISSADPMDVWTYGEVTWLALQEISWDQL